MTVDTSEVSILPLPHLSLSFRASYPSAYNISYTPNAALISYEIPSVNDARICRDNRANSLSIYLLFPNMMLPYH